MFRLVQIALYTAAMLALSWVLWQIVPPVYDWLAATFGSIPVFVAAVSIPLALWAIAFAAYRRHPEWLPPSRRLISDRKR